MKDTYLHKGLRRKLIDGLKRKGITDKRITDAMYKIPRHYFLPVGFEERAYQDNAFPIAEGQTISQPYTVAFQTQLLKIQKRDKVLEIGTGSGYQAAVLCEMGAKVFTIERHKELFKSAQIMLSKLGYDPYCVYGDGYKGLAGYAPFDKILLTAAATEIPEKLVKQLKPGGIMIAPVGDPHSQDMLEIIKIDDNNYEILKHGKFVFVPFVKGKN